ncbi:conjugal transfer protein TraW [Escherichia coli]
MKKSHQRSMKLAVLPCMIAVALSISGCTFSEINKMQKKAQEDSAHAREKVSALSARKSQALTWLDNQWINPVPVAQVSREKKQTAPACYITQARKGEITLQELGQRITAVCGIPVIITPDAANSTLEGGATRQMTGTLPAPDENGRLPLSSLGSTTMTTSTQPLTLNNLMWQGDINGLLDLMASRSGLYWRMDNGRIVFYLTETRTYPLHMLNTKTSSSSSVSSGSTSTMGATGGQDNSASGDATSSQSTTVGQEYDLYEDIRKTIEAMLTPEKGRYWLSASSSTLTVTDKGEVNTQSGRTYVGLQNEYNGIIDSASNPQLTLIADSTPNESTRKALAETLQSDSAAAYFDQVASSEAKARGYMSTREFEAFEAGRRYANTAYLVDLQEMQGDNLLRELVRITAQMNWQLNDLKEQIRQGNVISGQQLALTARQYYEKQLGSLEKTINQANAR